MTAYARRCSLPTTSRVDERFDKSLGYNPSPRGCRRHLAGPRALRHLVTNCRSSRVQVVRTWSLCPTRVSASVVPLAWSRSPARQEVSRISATATAMTAIPLPTPQMTARDWIFSAAMSSRRNSGLTWLMSAALAATATARAPRAQRPRRATWAGARRCSSSGLLSHPLTRQTTSKLAIIIMSSCSRLWQWNTYLPR